MARSKENPKSKEALPVDMITEDLSIDMITKVKPLEPWPDPPIQILPSQQPSSKPIVEPAPAEKDSEQPAPIVEPAPAGKDSE